MRRRFFIGRSRLGGRHLGGEREGSDYTEHCLRLSVVAKVVSGLRGRSSRSPIFGALNTDVG